MKKTDSPQNYAISNKYCTFAMLIYMIGLSIAITILSVMLTPLVDAFNIPVESEGLVSSINSLGSLLGLVFMILTVGRFTTVQLLTISGVLMTLLIACTGFMPTYSAVLICFFLFGISIGIIDGNSNAYIVELNGKNSGRFLGALHGTSGFGFVMAPLITQWFLTIMPWRTAFIAIAVTVSIPTAIFVITVTRLNGKCQLCAAPTYKLHVADYSSYILDKRNIVILTCVFLYMCSMNAINLWTVRFVATTLDAPRISSLCLSCYWLCATVSRFSAPAIRISAEKKYFVGAMIGFLCMSAGVLLQNAVIFCVMWGITGLVSGHSLPTLIDLGTCRYSEKPGLASSMLVVMIYVAYSICPMVISWLSSVFSMSMSMLFPGFVLLMSGLLILQHKSLQDKAQVGVQQP